ncbi:futalosine hydrolase [Sphingobacterium wenxiniae]|uniref:Futalosine hydrolase n=1 Tax=Sphingobacterium wenxiniae TaxID=683125 RepID=A0A1I6SDX5_9SPHI|nr:futalosine hydrolase [Sphingobacterium wenxiniae]SFS75171.1 futalosine hydrolase [Sphingobacterium wenxiniae]
MNILVVAATESEILPSLSFLESKKADVLITGVGMVATTYALTKKLKTSSYDLIINVGIGGVLNKESQLGEVYRVVEDTIYRFGAEDGQAFLSMDNLGFGKSTFVEQFPQPWDTIALPTIKGLTVNTVHGNAESIEQLRLSYPSNVMESMEGAAVFYVANMEKIPVMQLRASSNYIEPRNRAAWQIGLAVANLNDCLQKVIVSLR